MAKPVKNEGEGNRTAAHHYHDGTREFIESGKVGQSAEEAREAIEDENVSLRDAVKKGRRPARH